MPYTRDQFNKADVKNSFKKAVARAAGTVSDNVEILSVTKARRRNAGVVVETQIRASDAAGINAIKTTLGSGDALKTKLNTALAAEGLEDATTVSTGGAGGGEDATTVSTGGAGGGEDKGGGSDNTAAIAGGAGGGVVAIVGGVIAVYMMRKRSSASSAEVSKVPAANVSVQMGIPTALASRIFCPHCGTPSTTGGGKFCQACGKPYD